MKTIGLLVINFFSLSYLAFAQDTIYIYRSGSIEFKQAISNIDSIVFFKTTGTLPKITTSKCFNIKGDSAKAGGIIKDNGSSAITARGLCWSTNPNPTIANNKTTMLVNNKITSYSDSTFTDSITKLLPNTVYYVRAYATNNVGTAYGNQISFNSGYVMGSKFGGGIVFYNDGNAHGLICAETDQSKGADWGCYKTKIGGTSLAIDSGTFNTNSIILGCSSVSIAAKICYDLILNMYSDWYLPSEDELYLIYKNFKKNKLGGFANEDYWSSSEDDAEDAWAITFNSGSRHNYDKYGKYYVRAIRAF